MRLPSKPSKPMNLAKWPVTQMIVHLGTVLMKLFPIIGTNTMSLNITRQNLLAVFQLVNSRVNLYLCCFHLDIESITECPNTSTSLTKTTNQNAILGCYGMYNFETFPINNAFIVQSL